MNRVTFGSVCSTKTHGLQPDNRVNFLSRHHDAKRHTQTLKMLLTTADFVGFAGGVLGSRGSISFREPGCRGHYFRLVAFFVDRFGFSVALFVGGLFIDGAVDSFPVDSCSID
jgi:hypothetical protein